MLLRLLYAVVCISTALVQSACSEQVPLDGTSLHVALASGWQRAPVSQIGFQAMGLRYKGEPAFEITGAQNTKTPIQTVMTLPYECDLMLGVLDNVVNKGKSSFLLPRPAYIPQEFYARVFVPGPRVGAHSTMFACLYLGSSNLTVSICPAPTMADGAKLTEMLQSIVDSAQRNSTLLYAPGQLELPALGVTVSFSQGTWGVGKLGVAMMPVTVKPQIDLLVRTGGIAELKVMPVILSGRCSEAINSVYTGMQMKNRGGRSPAQLKKASFVSSAWEPTAIELHYESVAQPLIMVCRQISQSKTLQVYLAHESEEIPQSDAPLIAKALDEIAAAVMNKH